MARPVQYPNSFKVLRPVMFGNKDIELYEALKGVKNFSGYVKGLIRADLQAKGELAGRKEKTVDEKLDELIALLKSGATVEDIEQMEPKEGSIVSDEEAKQAIVGMLGLFGD